MGQIMKNAKMSFFLFACLFLLNVDSLPQESTHFSRIELSVKGQVLLIIPSDLNGDSLKDLIVTYRTGFSFEVERWLSIFFQRKGGAFNSSPDIILKVPEESSIIDVANIDDTLGEEIIFFTTKGISVYRELSPKKPPQLESILDVESITKVAAKKDLSYLDYCRDWLGLGKSELMIPGFLFSAFVDSHFLNEIISGRKLKAKADPDSNYDQDRKHDWLPQLEIGSFSEYSVGRQDALLSCFAFPSIFSLDENGDQLKDIIALKENRLFVFHQDRDHKLPASPSKIINLEVLTPEEKGLDLVRFSVILDDLNGDGIADAFARKMRVEGFANFVGDARIFFGKKEKGISEKPDQILTIPYGYYALAHALDYDGNGSKEISIFSVKLGLWGYVKMFLTHRLKVHVNIFMLDENERYPYAPALTDSYSVKIDLSREFDIPVYRIADFNGDQIQDLLFGTEKDELSVFMGTGMKKNKLFSKEASDFFTVDPYPRIAMTSLKDDEYQDLIFFYPVGKKSKGKIILMKNNRIW